MPQGRCQCGHARFDILGPALMRVCCHCTICQAFNRAAFADILVFRPDDVALPAGDRVSFDTYKRPPNVSRGRCSACGQAALERFESVPLFKVRMVPAAMLGDSALPEIKFHMFYNRRAADIEDDSPKYSGFVSSQLAFLRELIRARHGTRRQ